ncbi:MAG: hypothetical protein Q4G40_00255 [Brachybacterium sp.]|nr:hypothetical protein [Brachybacterium sp.]
MRAGLPEPQLNVPIVSADGTVLHEPDLQWATFAVAVEYEGAHHRTGEQLDRDIARADTIRRIGWDEIRVTAKHMKNGARQAVTRIRNALQARGWSP